jgi:hypothetical protein
MIKKFAPDVEAALAGIADGAVILPPGFGNGMPEAPAAGLVAWGARGLTLVVNSGGREAGPNADLPASGHVASRPPVRRRQDGTGSRPPRHAGVSIRTSPSWRSRRQTLHN